MGERQARANITRQVRADASPDFADTGGQDGDAVLLGNRKTVAMIGILIVAHDKLAESLVGAVTHVLGSLPPQFEAFGVSATDDPLTLLPRARERVATLDTGEGVLIFSDI